jgi:DNA polymerase III delta prime subunit
MNTEQKYRPKSIGEFVFPNDDVERKIRRYTTGKATRPLILHGPHGVGKSLLAEIIPKELEGRNVKIDYIRAEDLDSNVKVRHAFTRTKQFDRFFKPEDQDRNYTIVEEVNFDPRAKGALRTSLDDMEGRDLFIFTTNELEKLDSGLRSRAEMIEVSPVSPERFLGRAQTILKKEGILLDDSIVLEALDAVYSNDHDNRAYYKMIDEIIDAAGA